MNRKDNTRRIDLINRQHSGTPLSADEVFELGMLQAKLDVKLEVMMQPANDRLDEIINGLEKRIEDKPCQ